MTGNDGDRSIASRRTFLKGATAAGVAGVAGLGGLFHATRGARAAAGVTIDDNPTVTSDDGTVKWVAAIVTGRLMWDGFDEAVEQARIITNVELVRSDTLWTGTINDTGVFAPSRLNDNNSDGDEFVAGQEGHIATDADWGIVQENRDHWYIQGAEDDPDDGQTAATGDDGYGLPQEPAPTSYLTAHDDGSSQDTRVVMSSEYRLYDADGNLLTGSNGYVPHPSGSEDFVVTVNNEGATTSFGDTDAEGQGKDSARASGS